MVYNYNINKTISFRYNFEEYATFIPAKCIK